MGVLVLSQSRLAVGAVDAEAFGVPVPERDACVRAQGLAVGEERVDVTAVERPELAGQDLVHGRRRLHWERKQSLMAGYVHKSCGRWQCSAHMLTNPQWAVRNGAADSRIRARRRNARANYHGCG